MGLPAKWIRQWSRFYPCQVVRTQCMDICQTFRPRYVSRPGLVLDCQRWTETVRRILISDIVECENATCKCKWKESFILSNVHYLILFINWLNNDLENTQIETLIKFHLTMYLVHELKWLSKIILFHWSCIVWGEQPSDDVRRHNPDGAMHCF